MLQPRYDPEVLCPQKQLELMSYWRPALETSFTTLSFFQLHGHYLQFQKLEHFIKCGKLHLTISIFLLNYYTPTLCVGCYDDFICGNFFFFFKNELFKLLTSLECRSNTLLCGVEISSTEEVKQKLCIFTALYVYNKASIKKSLQERFLSNERKDS